MLEVNSIPVVPACSSLSDYRAHIPERYCRCIHSQLCPSIGATELGANRHVAE